MLTWYHMTKSFAIQPHRGSYTKFPVDLFPKIAYVSQVVQKDNLNTFVKTKKDNFILNSRNDRLNK